MRYAEFERQTGPFRDEVVNAAMAGKTSHVFNLDTLHQDPHNLRFSGSSPVQQESRDTWSVEELITFFNKMFADCTITYEESWVDDTPHTKHFRRQIMVDWSR